jgi:hypothetical protein
MMAGAIRTRIFLSAGNIQGSFDLLIFAREGAKGGRKTPMNRPEKLRVFA